MDREQTPAGDAGERTGLIAMELFELLATCLECGEQWHHAVPGALAAWLSLITPSRKPVDRCPSCGGQQTVFRRCAQGEAGKTS